MLVVLWVLLGVIGAAVAFVILWILFAQICGWLLVNPKKTYKERSKFCAFLYEASLVTVLRGLRVKVHLEGQEKVPQEGKFLLISNHISNFDALATVQAFRKYKLGAISKESNFKVPFFGRLIRRCNYYPIDRENVRNAAKTINLAAEVIKSNEASLLVYPEGTRNKEATGLLPFHNVVFKIAQRAAAPIVVMTARGTEKVKKRVPFRRSHVYLKVLDVISAEEAAAMKTDAIGDKIREMMLQDEQEFLAKQEAK